MSKIDFMDGTLSGKIERLVGVKRATANYVRRHVIPHDPKSEAQLARRARVKEVAEFGKRIYDPLLINPTMLKPKQQTAHNVLMHDNQTHINGPPQGMSLWQIHSGPLHFPFYWDIILEAVPPRAEFFWDANLESEAELTDSVYCVVYDLDTKTYIFSPVKARSDTTYVLLFPGALPAHLIAWLFFWKSYKSFSVTKGIAW